MNNTLEIIIPAYNCSKTLGRTFDSLVLQTNKNFSVLIIDDCSTEDIKSIINTYKNKLSIAYIRNNINLGCGMSRQVGIDNTKADYISFLDSDDMLLPNAINNWLTAIDGNKHDAIVSPFCSLRPQRDHISIKHSGFFMTHGKVYSTAFLRKYDIRESEQVKCNDDVYLNWQVFDLTDNICFLDSISHVYTERPDSISKSKLFIFRATMEIKQAENLAKQQILRFKDNPLEQYNRIQKQFEQMLFEEREYFTQQIEEIKHKVDLK